MNEQCKHMEKQTDERMAQYLRLYSCLFQTTVLCFSYPSLRLAFAVRIHAFQLDETLFALFVIQLLRRLITLPPVFLLSAIALFALAAAFCLGPNSQKV